MSLIITLLLALVLAVVSVPVVAIVSKNNANAFKTGDTSNFVEVGEIWDSTTKKFNYNLTTLIDYLSDGYNSDADATATDIRAYNKNGKSAGQTVLVTLGGLQWQVVYLTNDTASNQRTATLWLADSGSLKSTWSNGFYDSASNWSKYPSSMYGTSYIRVVTLNNGGSYWYGTSYASNSSSLKSYSQKTGSASVFSEFTVATAGDNNDLTDYIVRPKNVKYQAKSQGVKWGSYILMNDYLETVSSGYSEIYQDDDLYKVWGNDCLWLPSMQEMSSSGVGGIWQINETERGQTTDAYSWSRSSHGNLSSHACSVAHSGSSYYTNRVHNSYAVRPALHLNLESAASWASQVSVSTSNSSQGTVTSSGAYAGIYYRNGDLATITATPNPGYSFDYWLVNGTKITANPYSFTVNEDTTCVAYFRYYGASITSPNTTLNITSFRDVNNFTNYFVTPVTANLYIYSVQVGTTDTQILKSRSGNLNYSGASSFIRYTVNEDNKEISFEIMNLKGDIDIKLTYLNENQDLPNTSGGASINGVVVNASDGGQALLNGYDSEDENAVIHISAISYTGYSFAGWYVDDEILTFTNSSGQTVTADSSKLSIDIPLSAVKGKIITAKFTKNANQNINSETNNSHDFL